MSADFDEVLNVAAVPDELLLDDLKNLIIDADAEKPRSLQRTPGPSEVGHLCRRKLAFGAYKARNAAVSPLLGVNRQSDPLAAIMGTAMHSWLEEAVKAYNLRHGRIRFLPETRVTIRPGLTGTCDCLDLDTMTSLDWKGLSLDTPVPTPEGWSTIGALRAGDKVFAADGSVCTVTAKSPVFERDCYRLVFEDGTSILSDNVHEWVFDVNGKTQVLSSKQAVALVRSSEGKRQLRIVNAGPLQLPNRELPVPPYTLGAWLGDGESESGRISKPDEEVFEHIRSDGYEVRETSGVSGCPRYRVVGLTANLREAGVLGDKRIPDAYLRASADQRLQLLQGLMDTDGTWNRTRNQAVFSTSKKGLAEQVAELISSLGWKPRIWKLTKRGFGLETTAYDVTFIPFGANPFRLSRKADLVRIEGTARAKRRFVREIVPTMTVPTQCITVDSTDNTFLCGKEMIPTHNCPGGTRYAHYVKHGPSAVYRSQAHLYCRGWRNLGIPVEYAGIVFISRVGTLRQMHLWREPYNPELVDEILARLDSVDEQMAALKVDEDPSGFLQIPITPDSDCRFCNYWSPNPTGPFQCSGEKS